MKNTSFHMMIVVCIICSAFATGDEVTRKGGFQTPIFVAECTCTCNSLTLNASGLYTPAFGELDFFASEKATENCQEQCARNCGGAAECSEKDSGACDDCCVTYCSSAYGGSDTEACAEACGNVCYFKGFVMNTIDLIYLLAGIVGAIMITIHGIRFAKTDDPSTRNAAKKGVIYVLIALAIIVLSGLAVIFYTR